MAGLILIGPPDKTDTPIGVCPSCPSGRPSKMSALSVLSAADRGGPRRPDAGIALHRSSLRERISTVFAQDR